MKISAKSKFAIFIVAFFFLPLFYLSVQADVTDHVGVASSNVKTINIAVRAIRGPEAASNIWHSTIDHLNNDIKDYNFRLIPIVDFKEMEIKIDTKEVDFVLVNPATYVQLEYTHGITRIATLKKQIKSQPFTEFAAILFTKADRTDLNYLEDIRGKKIMAVHPEAFGGWWMVLRELKNRGIDPFQESAGVLFAPSMTQQPVVKAVLQSKSDFGVVRTGIIEEMVANNQISASDIKIIEPIWDHFPLPHSTKLYPEWPFAKVKHTSDGLAIKVLRSLLKITPQNQASIHGRYHSWTIPLDYSKVHDLLKDLELAPYDRPRNISIIEYTKMNLPFFFSLFFFVFLLVISSLIGIILNRKLKQQARVLLLQNESLSYLNRELIKAKADSEKSEKTQRRILDTFTSGIYITNPDLTIEYANSALQNKLGQNPVGEKCYKTIHNLAEKCHWCIYDDLKKSGGFIEYELETPDNKIYETHNVLLDQNRKLTIYFDKTDQKKAQAALVQSEERYRLITQNATDVIWILNLTQQKFTYISPSVFSLRGFTPEEAMAQDINQSLSPDSAKKVLESISIELPKFLENPEERKKRILFMELQQPCKDGSIIWIETSTRYQFNPQNEIEVIGISRNIDERKRLENEIKERELLLNQAGALAKIGGWKIDLKHNQLTWTQEVFRIHEMEGAEQPSIAEAVQFYDNHSLPIIRKAVNDAINFGNNFNLELGIITARGKKKPIRAIGQVHKDQSDQPVGIIGVFQDITEIKEKEKKLKEMFDKYKQLFEFMPVGISLADEKGKLIESNKKAIELLHISNEEHNARLISGDQWKIIRKDGSLMPDEEFASTRALKEKKLIENIELGVQTGEGQITWLNVSSVPSISEDGLIISYTDISERINKERQLMQYMAKLKEANAAKDKFFAIISHDLKNPFLGIKSLTQIIYNDYENIPRNELKDYIKQMLDSMEGTSELLLNLLDWSRSQKENIQTKKEILDAAQLIDSNIKLLNNLAIKKEVRLVVEKINSVLFHGDKEMLSTVIRNLLTNAIKFSPPNGNIYIKHGISNGKMTIEIQDEGDGIPNDVIEQVMNTGFVQSTKGTGGETGTGLGLQICKEFIEKNGGKLDILSASNLTTEKGSLFRITLDSLSKQNYLIYKDEKQIDHIYNNPNNNRKNFPTNNFNYQSNYKNNGSLRSINNHKKTNHIANPESNQEIMYRILLAEDQLVNQTIAKRILSPHGHQIDIADNGQQAIELFISNNYDIVLMDHEMPIKNGLEAASEIRRWEEKNRDKKSIILAVTAHDLEDESIQSRVDFNGHISKPLSYSEFIHKIYSINKS